MNRGLNRRERFAPVWTVLVVLALLAIVPLMGMTAQAAALEGNETAGLAQEPVDWFENGQRRKAYLATDELAVLKDFDGAMTRAVEPELLSEAQVVARRGVVTILRKPGAELATRDGGPAPQVAGNQALSPVLYPTRDKRPQDRMVLTGRVVIRFPKETTPDAQAAFADKHGLRKVQELSFEQGAVVFEAKTPWDAARLSKTLGQGQDTGITATPDWLRRFEMRAIPNDPLYPEQWHLQDNPSQGHEASLAAETAWDRYKSTASEVVAIVDNGVEATHEDLAANLLYPASWDYVDGDDDPSPAPEDPHGTACAGLAAAVGFNGIGLSGVAPGAGLAGIRLLGAESTINTSLALTLYPDEIDIYSSSWGPNDDGQTLTGPSAIVDAAIASGSTTGRNGLGSIYVWAGGNGRLSSDNSNYDGYANSPYVLAFGAMNANGDPASYSEPGANLVALMPSSDFGLSLTTTDLSGAAGYNDTSPNSTMADLPNLLYTNGFGGTSASAPLASGLIALALQANTALTRRDVRRVLVESAFKTDPASIAWARNGAGYHVSHDHGYGNIKAATLIDRAASWIPGALGPVGEEITISATADPGLAIPDNDGTGVASEVTIDSDLTVEFATVTFSASDHTAWGDLEVVLVSPSGTRSLLAVSHAAAGFVYDAWRFGSLRHMGEPARGVWRLEVKDLLPQDSGTFQSWRLDLHGTQTWTWVAPVAKAQLVQPAPGEARVTLQDISAGAVTSRLWDFGDGQTSTDEIVTHQYAANGDYTVGLTATGPGGQIHTEIIVSVTNVALVTMDQLSTGLTGSTASLVSTAKVGD